MRDVIQGEGRACEVDVRLCGMAVAGLELWTPWWVGGEGWEVGRLVGWLYGVKWVGGGKTRRVRWWLYVDR